ncbi:hypothetical protein [Marispirochaeta sp.]|jgi:hypothetical protein|uniref:hypothetical protein n=1 Tax=Marispirochaeta sp. TaxID=2038653 RepID=UPI0029C79599|nr:hypothetical protein [Marispirochaeta sp.]
MEDNLPDSEYNEFVQSNRSLILNGIFGSTTPIQVESSITFARYLNHVGIDKRNYLLFLKVLESNNQWIVDALIGKRNPILMFTVIKPNPMLVTRAFQLLSFWHPGQIYPKVLLAVIGIIQYTYYKPDDGFRIYNLEINDINNLGKFLDSERDQMQEVNALILDILDKISKMGEYRKSLDKNQLAKHAYQIRIAYFDRTKSLSDVIPEVLLVKLPQTEAQVSPSQEFFAFFQKFYNN